MEGETDPPEDPGHTPPGEPEVETGMTALHLMVMEGTVVMERTVVTERTVDMGMARRAMTMGATTKTETVPGTMGMKSLNTVA